MNVVETEDLTRVYRGPKKRPDVVALDRVTLSIGEGEVRGLLGPNGAGKTTLVRILCTVLLPTSGSASVLGHDVVAATREVRSRIGIVFGGERGVYWNLTGRQNLDYWAALYGVPGPEARRRIGELLERVRLTDRADDMVEGYSRGMKQRLHLARGLVANAQVLFLDEPTTGMDPVAARDFRELVRDLRSEGRTVLLTTHDMAEAEAVCDRVALIDRGKLLAVETPRTLSELIARYERIDFHSDAPDLVDWVRRVPGVRSIVPGEEPDSYRVEPADEAAIPRVLESLVAAGVTSIRTSRPSLEEVYLHLIGNRGG
jgi:ABC-2 type transport system ATP-binding protein